MKIKAKKSLGQHFLFDKNICSAIVSSSIPINNKMIVEVGPGYGTLTEAILKQNPKHLFLIEKDSKLAEHLGQKYAGINNVTVIEQDALKVNLNNLCDDKIIIIANLPYNVGTELLCNWLCYLRPKIEHLTLMLQKEVVERICAEPRTKNYGRLSILCQFLAKVTKDFDVEAAAFTPPPKVESSIVQISPLELELNKDEFKLFQQVIRTAFSAKRKMIKTALKSFLSSTDFISLKIDDNKRPEELDVNNFWQITKYILVKNKMHNSTFNLS
jgi:16S rRNA (adenine1518-N6/adenine1519-N6)-dimethyltransferase